MGTVVVTTTTVETLSAAIFGTSAVAGPPGVVVGGVIVVTLIFSLAAIELSKNLRSNAEYRLKHKSLSDFKTFVKNFLDTEWKGAIVESVYDQTGDGHFYGIIVTKVVWYAVRMFIDDGNSEKPHVIVYKSEHLTLEGARQKVRELKNKYEKEAERNKTEDEFKTYISNYIKHGGVDFERKNATGNTLKADSMGSVVEIRYAKTANDRWFCVLITKVVWYAVRLLVDDGTSKMPYHFIYRSEHATLDGAKEKMKEIINANKEVETNFGEECKIHPKNKQNQVAMHQSQMSKSSKSDFRSKNGYPIVSSANEAKKQANLPPQKPQNTNTANNLTALVSMLEIQMPSGFSFNAIAHVNNAREGLLHILAGHGHEFDVRRLTGGLSFNSILGRCSSNLQNLVTQLNQQQFTDKVGLDSFQIQFNQQTGLRDTMIDLQFQLAKLLEKLMAEGDYQGMAYDASRVTSNSNYEPQ
ncbi:hypothetical protein FO519_009243 [Halicephalobus sp. NKZ332]|nr:hypothetical protein FO519_009243 [Halicephalobus sp. NKZ332]